MKIAIVSPYGSSIKHRVRGVGSYFENLKKSLLKFDKENQYVFIPEEEKLKEKIDLIHYPYFEPFFLTLPFFKKSKNHSNCSRFDSA